MPPREPPPGGAAELGFTLIELVVLVAILAIIAGAGYATLAQKPAQARSAAVAFAALVADARALASISGDADGGSGATIAVTREGDVSVAALYAFRPIPGAANNPTRAPNTPPLRTATALLFVRGRIMFDPPFALFFSASGHASAQAPFAVGAGTALPFEPECLGTTGVVIAFVDGVHDQAHSVSCEMARLDLDTSLVVPPR